MDRPLVTWLYVPGDRPDRVSKALISEADVVIIDLEDGVPPSSKPVARETVRSLLASPPARAWQVRINSLRAPDGAADVELLSGGAVDVRVPKVESAGDVHAVGSALPSARLHCLIETAAGLERAYQIADAAGVVSVSLGEADLSASLGTISEDGLDWARSRVVVAAAAVGLPPPAQSVYTNVKDLDGLRASCLRGRGLGMFGRAAIHPAQLAVIRDAYRPTSDEVSRAQEVLAKGAGVLPDGRFVDPAVVRAAERTLALADHARED